MRKAEGSVTLHFAKSVGHARAASLRLDRMLMTDSCDMESISDDARVAAKQSLVSAACLLGPENTTSAVRDAFELLAKAFDLQHDQLLKEIEEMKS